MGRLRATPVRKIDHAKVGASSLSTHGSRPGTTREQDEGIRMLGHLSISDRPGGSAKALPVSRKALDRQTDDLSNGLSEKVSTAASPRNNHRTAELVERQSNTRQPERRRKERTTTSDDDTHDTPPIKKRERVLS
jgi:hypothetical protein